MSKNLLDRSKNLTITEHINLKYREFALYVLQSRGIPNFYDSFTPVQRLIMEYAPTNFNKTLSLVGEVISSGNYHHGDSSLASAVSRLAKNFGCSHTLLNGDGFFGSPVKPQPAAARYTSVKIDPQVKEIVQKHWDLNERNSEGSYDSINLETPIGLMTHVLGIAVGYRSNILPRKIEDVNAYLEGENKVLKPYFKNFRGKISKFPELENSWLIESEIETDETHQTIRIGDLSPLLRYDSTMERILMKIEEVGVEHQIFNRSTDSVDVLIKIKGSKELFKVVKERVQSAVQHVVREGIVFVKDGKVIEYGSIHDYLNDFRVQKETVILKRLVRDNDNNSAELSYLEAKLKFLEWMMGSKRKNDEILKWLSQWESRIATRLSKIELVKLSPEEIVLTKKAIDEYKKTIAETNKRIKKQESNLSDIKKKLIVKVKTVSKTSSLIPSFEPDYVKGIEIWKPEEEDEMETESDEIGEETEDI
jgi:DNA gyrase/topoisomerase IV subunit A